MNLSGKIIIVSGGAGLLGNQIIKNIKSNGGIPVSIDIKNKDDINKNIMYFDLDEDKSILKIVQKILSKYNRIDGLVNNAYPRTTDWGSSFEETEPTSFSKNVDLQLSRVFALSKPILEIMKNQKSGSIVNMASIYGMVGNDFSIYENTLVTPPPAYSAIKGGLINFNRYIASYFAPYNVRSNCVSPGGIFDNQDPVFVEQYEKKVPMNRMGKPEDIAPLVSFLLSDYSKYITGQNIAVDGGWTSI